MSIKKLLQNLTFLLLATFFVNAGYAQNVKYKKGEVFIDKELAFVITENARASKKEKRTYKMVDASGDLQFTLNYSDQHYEQLEHELIPRLGYAVHVLDAPNLNKTTNVPEINLLNFPNRINYLLKKTDLYATKTFSESVFDDFADKLKARIAQNAQSEFETIKEGRTEMNKKSISILGPLRERESGLLVVNLETKKVFEGGKVIFKFNEHIRKKAILPNSARKMLMFNPNGELIGWIDILEKSPHYTVSLGKPDFERLEEDEDDFSLLGTKDEFIILQIPKLNDLTALNDQGRMERIAKYLFDIGAL